MSDLVSNLAEALVTERTASVFGITGSGASLSLITELERSGVPYFDVPHEAAAAIMAGTVARRTARPAVSISIKGPGFANMLPGIAHNYFECNPAISVSEAYGATSPPARQHKRVDQASIVGPLVKAVAGGAASSEEIRKAIQLASAEAPGPVHFELADGVRFDAIPESTQSESTAEQLSALLRRVARSERPIVIAGSLATRRSWGAAVSRLRIPVFTTTAAKGLVDESTVWSCGVYTGDGRARSPEANVIPESDLVVCLGVRDNEILSPWSRSVEVVGLDEIAAAKGFPFTTFETSANGEAEASVIDSLAAKEWGSEICCRARRDLQAALVSHEWLPVHCYRLLQAHAPEQTLVSDTGAFCTIAEHAWIASPRNDYLGSSNGRYMGVGLPMAVAAALVQRPKPVLCSVGDGGIRTYPAILKLAVDQQLPLTVVLMRDSRYGSIAAAARGFTYNVAALSIAQPSWVDAVTGLGIEAATACSAAEFDAALSRRSHDGPFFIEAVFDPDPYMRMTDEIR